MQLSFLKKIKQKQNYINSLDDIPKYVKFSNREIQIDTLTPQIANQVDELIRFWNLVDDDFSLVLSGREPIKIFINSIGGNLDAAITIMDSIKISKTPVYTFNIGNVFKESFLIFLAGHKRYTYPNSKFMYSDSILLNTELETPIAKPVESSFYSKSAAMDKIALEIKTFILENTTITETQYDKHYKNEWWFSAEDAYKLHIANSICREHYHYLSDKKN